MERKLGMLMVFIVTMLLCGCDADVKRSDLGKSTRLTITDRLTYSDGGHNYDMLIVKDSKTGKEYIWTTRSGVTEGKGE